MIRLINIGLLLAFSLCYMEWGHDGSSFIFQTEYDIFRKDSGLLATLTHPLILFGLTGQVFLLISAIRKRPNRVINLLGLCLLGITVLLILMAGVLSRNIKMIASVFPFLILSILYFRNRRKHRRSNGQAEGREMAPVGDPD